MDETKQRQGFRDRPYSRHLCHRPEGPLLAEQAKAVDLAYMARREALGMEPLLCPFCGTSHAYGACSYVREAKTI